MDLNKLLDTVTPDIYESLKKAIETGKWDNGIPLTDQQKKDSLQIVIAYDNRHKPEHERVGYVQPKEHSHCGSTGDEWQTLDIKDS